MVTFGEVLYQPGILMTLYTGIAASPTLLELLPYCPLLLMQEAEFPQ